MQRKKSVREIAHPLHSKTAKTIQLLFKTDAEAIWCILSILLASECTHTPMKMYENEGGRAHSDANKITQSHDINWSWVSFERRIV